MIPRELLAMTEFLAPGICTYGGPGMKKTFAVHTLPAPIIHHDFEGGTGPLMPWVRRVRNSDESRWMDVSQEAREKAFQLLIDKHRETNIFLPSPRIDIIKYDTFDPTSYDHFVNSIANQDPQYNSLCVDSLQELSFDIQSRVKGIAMINEPMELKLWSGVQERNAMQLRKLNNLRAEGLIVYLIGSEMIDKDYVTDPRSKAPGTNPEAPYSVKATVNLPGQMAGKVPHLVDILLHARPMGQKVTWVSKPEPLPAGNCSWEAKDRFGRLDDYHDPDFRKILMRLYGKEGMMAIYATENRDQTNVVG